MFDKFYTANVDIIEIFKRVLQSHEKDIEALNKAQLDEGRRSDGTFLPPYSSAYAKRKGKSLTPKTLKDKGAFHEGIFETFFKDSFNMESSDWKSDILEHNWGKKIFGLTKENKLKLLNELGVKEELISQVRQATKNV
jgi:hypothetical protein